MSQMKEQDKIPEKQLTVVEKGNLPKKRIQNNDSENDPGSWEKNEEDARNVYKDLENYRGKKKIEVNSTLERLSSRIIEAKEQTSDLEGKMVEITATKQIIEKIMKK